MSKPVKVLVPLLAIISLALVWLWANQTQKVDMADYAPADTLIYLEANSLPEIAHGIVSTNAWKSLAPAAGIDTTTSSRSWLTRFAEWTGIGPAESVIFARAQVAVCILGFGATETPETTLRITPRGAVVIETHTASSRVRSVAEKTIGDFARRSIHADVARREERGETLFLTWLGRDGSGRQIVVAVHGSLIVIGNDELSVQACLAVRKGERPSLARDLQLKEMRERLVRDGALAFGYAPAGSAAKIAEALSPLLSQQASEDSRVQGMIAGLLPKFAHKTFGSAAWSTRVEQGRFLDDYILNLHQGIGSRLALAASPPQTNNPPTAASLLPPQAHQVTIYHYNNPEAAWLSLNAGLSTRVDAVHAPIVTLALEALLKPYGVESPREFLRAAGNEILTARLTEESESKLLIVAIKDRAKMKELILASLGEGTQESTDGGDVQLFLSSESEERRAAAFASEYVILGREDDVRASISARSANPSANESQILRAAFSEPIDFQPHVRTLTSDSESAASFIAVFARARKSQNADMRALQLALAALPYSVGETRITNEGMQKRTRSSFGLIGSIIARFSVEKESDTESKQQSSN